MSDTNNNEEYYVDLIRRQTDYSEEDARRLLKENNYDAMVVIKKFMGVYKEPKEEIIDGKSRNQEIFKQFRKKLHIEKLPNA